MPPEKNEQERREIIGRLERQYQDAEAKRLKGEQDAAFARVEKSNLSGALRRAQLPFPEGDVCPECWITHGRVNPMRPVPSPEPRLYDRWKCPADDCGHTSDRQTGMR